MWRRYTLLCLLVLFPFVSGAQFDLGNFGTPALNITLSPAHPSPGESVTASIDDYAGGLYGARITWTYDGIVLEDAANQRSIEIAAGAPGAPQTLQATLQLPQGGVETVSTTINPAYLDIIFEPQTRTPDWYAGRALPSLGSQVNATALLSAGSFYNSNNVVYTWRVDQKVLEGGPIRGGNRVSFVTPRGAGATVRVTATDLQGTVIASRAIRIQSVVPELHFYEEHSLYGQQQVPIDQDFTLVGNALTLQAEPYFLDTRVYNQPDVAQWEINSQDTDNGSNNPYEIALTRSGAAGRTVVNFHVRSLREVLQGAEEQITVNF